MTGPELRSWRLAHNLTQWQLGAYLGFGVTTATPKHGAICRTIQRYEAGTQPIPRVVELALTQFRPVTRETGR